MLNDICVLPVCPGQANYSLVPQCHDTVVELSDTKRQLYGTTSFDVYKNILVLSFTTKNLCWYMCHPCLPDLLDFLISQGCYSRNKTQNYSSTFSSKKITIVIIKIVYENVKTGKTLIHTKPNWTQNVARLSYLSS